MVGVAGGEIDVVEHDDDGASQLVAGSTQLLHHLDRVLHVQVVQRLVQQDVVGVLGQHHGDIGALTLTAGELVEVPVLQLGEVEEVDGLGDVLLVLDVQATVRMRVASETDQLAHRQAGDEVVLLPQDGQFLGDLPGRGPEHVLASDGDGAGVRLLEASDHGEQGGLAGAVGADECRHATGGDVEADGADGDLVAVGPGDVVEGDHRRPFRRMNRRNTDPPMSSMMIVTAPSASKKFRMMK